MVVDEFAQYLGVLDKWDEFDVVVYVGVGLGVVFVEVAGGKYDRRVGFPSESYVLYGIGGVVNHDLEFGGGSGEEEDVVGPYEVVDLFVVEFEADV